MKVLFLTGAADPDYMCDALLHGLRMLLGADCVDVVKPEFMYRGPPQPRFHTMYSLLEDIPVDRQNIPQRIRDREFNAVVYGSVHRCLSYWDEVSAAYSPNKIALVDGEDHSGIHNVRGSGIYFKRELQVDDADLHPIEFAVPAEKIRTINVARKTRLLAPCDPRDRSTYQFHDESQYYDQYSDSYFGYTMKKGGWDCLRHYEIMAAGCLPYFEDLESCPPRTLYWLPKDLLLEARQLYHQGAGALGTYPQLLDRVQAVLASRLTTVTCAMRVLEVLL